MNVFFLYFGRVGLVGLEGLFLYGSVGLDFLADALLAMSARLKEFNAFMILDATLTLLVFPKMKATYSDTTCWLCSQFETK